MAKDSCRNMVLSHVTYHLNMRYNVLHNSTTHICSEKKQIYLDRSKQKYSLTQFTDSLTAKCCLISETRRVAHNGKQNKTSSCNCSESVIILFETGRNFQRFHHDIRSPKSILMTHGAFWHQVQYSKTRHLTRWCNFLAILLVSSFCVYCIGCVTKTC